MCGRTDHAIAERWAELTNPLRGESEITPAEESTAKNNNKVQLNPLEERTNSNESLRRFANQIEKEQESRHSRLYANSPALERHVSEHVYESIRHTQPARKANSSSPNEYVNTKADYVNTRPIYTNSPKVQRGERFVQTHSLAIALHSHTSSLRFPPHQSPPTTTPPPAKLSRATLRPLAR